jgi:PAS domain-containing protein
VVDTGADYEITIRKLREISEHLVDPEITSELFEVWPDCVIVTDTKGIIKLVNTQAEMMFGYTRGRLSS